MDAPADQERRITGVLMNRINNSILALALAAFFLSLAGGCAKKSVDSESLSRTRKPEGVMYGAQQKSGQDEDGNVTAGDLESLDKTGINPLSMDTMSDEYKATYGRSTKPLYPVFFAFDSSSLNVDQLEKLNSSGNHLLADPGVNVVLEGNCDQRGTAEYNLALGESRAISVKKYLANLGVAEQRMTTISYGDQRPLYPGSDETSWAMNRRVDLVVP